MQSPSDNFVRGTFYCMGNYNIIMSDINEFWYNDVIYLQKINRADANRTGGLE